ncbi:MAG: TetR/AcrR family transcriptional regulator [Thermodesulfobacteriota bacterium]
MKKKSEQVRRSDGLERQAQILAVSLDIFSEKGYHATRVDDIIKASHIAKSTFYFHFKNKKEILSRIIDIYFPLLYDAIKQLDISIKKPVTDVRAIFLAVARSLADTPEFRKLLKILLSEIIGSHDPFLDKVDTFFNDLVNLGVKYISRAQKDGTVSGKIDPFITALCVIGGLKEVLYRWLVKNDVRDVEKAFSSIVDLYFKGMVTGQ